MKQFIKKILLFTVYVLCCIILLTIVNCYIVNSLDTFKLKKEQHVLILGDSQTQYAFNDTDWANISNKSSAADSYLYSYKKLKEIIKSNPQVDTVLLSFASHNIEKSIEEEWLLNSEHSNSRMRIYFPLLDLSDALVYLKNKPSIIGKGAFSQALLSYYLLTQGPKAYGGYSDLHRNILDKKLNELKENKPIENQLKVSTIEIEYLNKIIAFCNSNNVHLILVNTPKHAAVQDNQEFLYSVYVENFKDTPFYDCSKVKLDDKCFGDFVHLTPIGAKQFTDWFKTYNILDENQAKLHNILY